MIQPALVRFHDVSSPDGTRLRAWSNGGSGPAVLISNGLGTNPYAWPTLLQPDNGMQVVGWNHRGIGGSERPESGRVDMDAHLEDMVAVLDDAGMETAVLVGWSIGVNVAFEFAVRYPERVKGILAVSGVPGATFSTMLEPWKVPPLVAQTLMTTLARISTVTGHGLAPVTSRIPWTRFSINLLKMARVFDADADDALLRSVVQEFFTSHPAWYAQLALEAARHDRVSLSQISVPVSLVAGTKDLLAGPEAMRSAAARIPRARYRVVEGTHFLPVEHPELVLEELHRLLERVS
ncbi:alpha/beta fold hydrolase [Aeromicrobium sp. Leaf350]|uniref:alpha/beta fold hydrolase n=1 Tax=Aeromicrobium sp. Leaf350 TaxID=2876565 RepID=UPI001E3B59CC|nr:alpha/beta hydrolase [Aeromicrobium sp. Leaf350]